MYVPTPGSGSGQGGGADPSQQNTGELLADIFSTSSAVRGRGADQMDWPVHGQSSSGGGRVESGEVTPASAHEEDPPVGNNPNTPGVWLDFLSTPAAGVSSPTSANDNGNVSHPNVISSASTPAAQAQTPVVEDNAGEASASTTGPGLRLYGMEPGDRENAAPPDAEEIEEQQESGDD